MRDAGERPRDVSLIEHGACHQPTPFSASRDGLKGCQLRRVIVCSEHRMPQAGRVRCEDAQSPSAPSQWPAHASRAVGSTRASGRCPRGAGTDDSSDPGRPAVNVPTITHPTERSRDGPHRTGAHQWPGRAPPPRRADARDHAAARDRDRRWRARGGAAARRLPPSVHSADGRGRRGRSGLAPPHAIEGHTRFARARHRRPSAHGRRPGRRTAVVSPTGARRPARSSRIPTTWSGLCR